MQQLNPTTFRPRMQVISKDQAWTIHTAALEILSNTGFTMEHDGARKMLLDAGCTTGADGRLRMPAYLAENALKTAPRRITLYNQQGERAMDLVDENFYYGTGSDTIFTHDVESGERRRTNLADVGNFALAVDALENMDFAMSMGNPEDVPIADIYVHVFGEMVRQCNKPICFIADSGRDMARIYEIACIVAGGADALEKRPFILNYSEAISPLRYPQNVMEKLIFCAEKQIPICLPSGCNAGGGGPVTLAGAMALGIAENLVGLVVHQLTKPGAPFLFAPNVSILDMRSTVISYGCPEWSLTQAALADMRDEIYGLPIWSFAGSSDSKLMDAQAGAEAAFSILTAMKSRCNLIHDVGYIEHGNTSSLEMLVLADELVAMTRHFMEGIPVNPETLALEAINRVAEGGPGSMFLADVHTFDHFREAHFAPKLIDRFRYETWEKNGSQDMYQRCNAAAQQILENHAPMGKPKEMLKEIDAVLLADKEN